MSKILPNNLNIENKLFHVIRNQTNCTIFLMASHSFLGNYCYENPLIMMNLFYMLDHFQLKNHGTKQRKKNEIIRLFVVEWFSNLKTSSFEKEKRGMLAINYLLSWWWLLQIDFLFVEKFLSNLLFLARRPMNGRKTSLDAIRERSNIKCIYVHSIVHKFFSTTENNRHHLMVTMTVKISIEFIRCAKIFLSLST